VVLHRYNIISKFKDGMTIHPFISYEAFCAWDLWGRPGKFDLLPLTLKGTTTYTCYVLAVYQIW